MIELPTGPVGAGCSAGAIVEGGGGGSSAGFFLAQPANATMAAIVSTVAVLAVILKSPLGINGCPGLPLAELGSFRLRLKPDAPLVTAATVTRPDQIHRGA